MILRLFAHVQYYQCYGKMEFVLKYLNNKILQELSNFLKKHLVSYSNLKVKNNILIFVSIFCSHWQQEFINIIIL